MKQGQGPENVKTFEAGKVLSVEDVRKSFRTAKREVPALRGISMEAQRGFVTGLIGPDGAGKTTVMRLAAGLLTPDSGRITVLGFDAPRQAMAIQAAIGYMPQRFGLYEDLTVRENLDLYADLQGVPAGNRPDRYRELMQMTGLEPFTGRLAGRLSGGMKQKLGLACTLVRSPALLLLDEPTVGVDPVSRRELWSIVYRLVRDERMSVLLSTAYLDEAERCDMVIMLHEGEVLDQGPPGELRERMSGRTYAVNAPGVKKRELQERLAASPGVTDVVVQSEGVRLVTETSVAPDIAPIVPGASLKPVPPRFEDVFVAVLGFRTAGNEKSGTGGRMPGGTARHGKGTGPVIEVKDVKRRFGEFYAVKGITFEVEKGEVFGLLGANGAGKSTTFRMLCGLLPATSGTLRVSGLDLRVAAAHARARIGYMSQRFSLYGNLSVRENMRFFSSAYGISGTHRDDRIRQALDLFGLGPYENATSTDLPLGYKQRLALACALMHDPDILFLDEPTSGVDPLARREFWRRIARLSQEGVTVLVTTHFLEEAEYCDRLAIMADGEILAIGSPEEIKAKAAVPGSPQPGMEDAFITLIEAKSGEEAHV